MDTKPPLAEALKLEIDKYLSERPNRSIASLARKSGLAYSTVRRMAQGEAQPELSTVITILGATLGREGFISFLKGYFPKEGAVFENHFSNTQKFSDEELDFFLRDEISNFIIHMSCTRHGTDVDTIQRILGGRGMDKLDNLVEAGYIDRRPDGKIWFYKESFAYTNFETFLISNAIHTRIFDIKNIGSDAALLAHQTETVDAEGLRQIKQAGLEYLHKLMEIKKNQPGSIPFYVTLMQNIYDDSAIKE
ncbi:hypothetical protein N9W79_00405 [bacterium]|nr:hypothetical protein [bacterium]